MLAPSGQNAVPPLHLERVHRQYVATGITSVIERSATVEGYRRTRPAARRPVERARDRDVSHPASEDAAQVEQFITAGSGSGR